MRVPVFALVLGGCSFSAASPGSSLSDAASDSDPPIIDGAPLDGTIPPACAGVFVHLCVDPPQSQVTLTTQKIDTTNSQLCAAHTSTPSTPDACVISGQSITIPSNNTVSVIGNRQLILFSTGSITISGTLDAAGHGKTNGPSDNKAPCGADVTNPTKVGVIGGGGWGGSFGGPGSNGGNGASGAGGLAGTALGATALRGGCPGGNGAAGGQNSGDHGGGGGSVLLIATQTITIDGILDASGAGGGGGSLGGGGGGGGSGGMIVLDAATVNTSGKCFANGGGGGEGGNLATGRSGGEPSAPDSAGGGGKGGASTGGDGGNSAFGATAATVGKDGTKAGFPPGDGGGGGGGGSVGVIQVFSTNPQNTTDPKKIAPLPSS